MNTEIDTEIRYAFRHILEREDGVRDMCKTAEEWHDGVNSRMKAFYRNRGLLGSGSEYRELADEATEALSEVKQTDWRAKLETLRDFGRHLYDIDKSLRAVAKHATSARLAGVADQCITDVLAAAMHKLN